MNKKELLAQANKIHLRTNENVLNQIEAESEKLMHHINILQSIDTEGVEPMVRVDETPISFLREDEPTDFVLDKEVLLNNAPETKGDYVALKKVVSND